MKDAPPACLRLFERIMFVAVGAGAVSAALTIVDKDVTVGATTLVISLLATLAVPLLAALAITRDGSRFAVWLLFIVTLADLVPWMPLLSVPSTIATPSILLLVQFILQAVALGALLHPECRTIWRLGGSGAD